MARQKALDDAKRGEICGLITVGMSLAKAARRVGCARRTVYHHIEQDPEFAERVRRARLANEVSPRAAMRQFAAKHWRAAAWLLDREERLHERHAVRRADAKRLARISDAMERLSCLMEGSRTECSPAAPRAAAADELVTDADLQRLIPPLEETKRRLERPPRKGPQGAGRTVAPGTRVTHADLDLLSDAMETLARRMEQDALDEPPADPSADAPHSIGAPLRQNAPADRAAPGAQDPTNTD